MHALVCHYSKQRFDHLEFSRCQCSTMSMMYIQLHDAQLHLRRVAITPVTISKVNPYYIQTNEPWKLAVDPFAIDVGIYFFM